MGRVFASVGSGVQPLRANVQHRAVGVRGVTGWTVSKMATELVLVVSPFDFRRLSQVTQSLS